jgi:hypothetical protein
MSNEIIQNITYDNYDDFQHVNFIFSQNFISLFWGLFNDKIDLSVTYTYTQQEEGYPFKRVWMFSRKFGPAYKEN